MNQNDEKVVLTEKSEEILQEIKNLPDDQQEMMRLHSLQITLLLV